MSTVNADHPDGPPVLTVTRGGATPAEIAAVVAVLLSVRASAVPAGEPEPASRWAEGSRARAVFPRPGPHSWRASALPR